MPRANTKEGKENQDANLQIGMWQRGQSGNPNGRPRRALRQLEERIGIEFNVALSKEDKFQIIESLLELSANDLDAISKDKTAPAFVVAIAGALCDDIKKKRMYSAELIFDRMFGKPKSNTELSNPDGSMQPKTTIIFSDGSKRDDNNDTPKV